MTTRKFDPVRDVRDFHQAFDQRVASYPEFPEQDERALRVKLLREEFGEYIAAEEGDDFIEVADALADMLYIICGTAVSYGIPLEDLHNEVHRSNMDKLVNGKPIKREDGKVIKPDGWEAPNVEMVIYKALETYQKKAEMSLWFAAKSKGQ